MKVAILCTSDRQGGAAIAAFRLSEALISQNVQVTMLVCLKKSDATFVQALSTGKIGMYYEKIRLLYEKLWVMAAEKSTKFNFAFTVANNGLALSKHPNIASADIVHLHWVNHGFLSLQELRKILLYKKKIVWTFHDMWAFTGGCFYSNCCKNYENSCGNCPMLHSNSQQDLSSWQWKLKEKVYQAGEIYAVTCSQWLGNIAKTSQLFKNKSVISIPNPININVFQPIDKTSARKKWNIDSNKFIFLFASDKLMDKRKGFHLFVQAIELLKKETDIDFEIAVFGKGEDMPNVGIKTHILGRIEGEANLAMAYSLANCLVVPSLEDNLPNTVMESLACGVPVLGFETGGIPEMVKHQKNGYLTATNNIVGLKDGIQWMLKLSNAEHVSLCENARNTVCNTFAYPLVAQRYMQLYNNILEE